LFQTEPILFLQSLASDGLTTIMWLLSRAASPDVLGALVLVVAFGLSLRAGLALAEAVFWTELLTGLVKQSLELPRPADVDSRVRLLADSGTSIATFTAAGGQQMFDLPDPRAMAAVRLAPAPSYGFPSSAVSTATAFWGGAGMLFRSGGLMTFAAALVTLTALARLYLGRHFIADVLGGAGVGLVVLGVLRRSVLRPQWAFRSPVWPPVLTLIPLVLLLLVPHVDPASAGGLSGLYAARLLLQRRELPSDRAGTWRRIARVLVALAAYAAVAATIGLTLRTVALEAEPVWAEYLATGIAAFAVFWGGVRISERLGLYRPLRPTRTHGA
jgi:membrane-associated phospholipid phosphatase